MNEEQMRKEFEEWWGGVMSTDEMPLNRTRYPMTNPEKQQYMCHETNRSWFSWRASRQAMKPIKLPDETDTSTCKSIEKEILHDGINYGIQQCREAIQQAGYEVEE